MPLLTPPPTPGIQRGDRATFANRVDAFITWLINFVTEMLALVAGLNTLADGAAYAIPYTVDLSSTTDADPTAGKLRFNAATQNAATTLFADLLGSDAVDYTSILDQFDASTSTVKGQIRIVKQGDPTKFLTFDVTARTSATGYRKLVVTNTGGSSASPFANGDGVIIKFTRTGDKGSTGAGGVMSGYVQTADQTITAGGALTIAHGLATAPKMVQGFLKCTVANNGYAVGDITPALYDYANSRGVSITFDATNLYVRFGAGANPVPTLAKDSGAALSVSPANWAFFIRAFT